MSAPSFGLFRAPRSDAAAGGGQTWVSGSDEWFRSAVGTPSTLFPGSRAATPGLDGAVLLRQIDGRPVLCLQIADPVATAARGRLERCWALASSSSAVLWRDALCLLRALHTLASRPRDLGAFDLPRPADDPARRMRGLGLALAAWDAGLFRVDAAWPGVTAVADRDDVAPGGPGAADLQTMVPAAVALHLLGGGVPVAVLADADGQEREEFVRAGWAVTLAPAATTSRPDARKLRGPVASHRDTAWTDLEAAVARHPEVLDARLGPSLQTRRTDGRPDTSWRLDVPRSWLPFAALDDHERAVLLGANARQPDAVWLGAALDDLDRPDPQDDATASRHGLELCWLADEWRHAGAELGDDLEQRLARLRDRLVDGR